MNISREEAQQILDALEDHPGNYKLNTEEATKHGIVVDLLQSRLAEGEQDPVAWMYPSDLEKFQKSETFAQAFSIKVGCPDEVSVPLYAAPQGAPK